MNEEDTDRVKEFINNNLNNNELKSFLENLLFSSNTNQMLLCICILIDISGNLLSENNYVNAINDILKSGDSLDFESFVSFFDQESQCFCEKYSNHPGFRQQKYSKVMTVNQFYSFVGDATFKPKNRKFRKNERLRISRTMIEVDWGWSGYKEIAWVTPQDTITDIINNPKSTFPANDVCDHVGIARTKDYLDKMGPQYPKGMVIVNYSEDFNEEVFQPNTSNADFNFIDILYISHLSRNGFGKTYNENNITFAREHIHKKSHYFDDNFNAQYLGEISEDSSFTKSKILKEALSRLGL